MLITKINGLQTKLCPNGIMISAAGGKAVGCFIIHDKQVAAVEMAVHFLYSVFIKYIRFLYPEKMRWQFF